MTKDEIMQIAREAGIVVVGEAVEKLCELVAAAEREECAKIAEKADAISGLRSALSIRLRGKE